MLSSEPDVLLRRLGDGAVWGQTLNPTTDGQYKTPSFVAVPKLPGVLNLIFG